MPSFMNTIGNISLFIEDFQGLEELRLDNPEVTIGYREYIYTVELGYLGSLGIYMEIFEVTVRGEEHRGRFLFESELFSLPAVLEIVEKRLRELLTDWHLEPADYYK